MGTKLSQIAPASSSPALTDQLVGVTGGATDNLYSLSQIINTLVGTGYCVSPTGSDSNNGQSQATAWQTIAKVNASTFQPGDSILFQGGQTFSGALVSPSSGTPAAPITFGSYGNGRATISSGNSNGFTSTDQSGVIVRDLIFTGTASTNIGIYFNISSTALPQNVQAINCSVSGYGWSGIQIWSVAAGYYSDVTLLWNTITNCCSVATSGVGSSGIWAGYGHKNVNAFENTSSSNAGATDTVNTGNGIKFSRIGGGAISKCTSFGNGGSCSVVPATGGPGGIVVIYSDSVIVSECVSHSNLTATSLGGGVLQDGNGIDIDGGCTNCHAIGNYTHDNYGAGLAMISFSAAGTFNGNSLRNNTSVNDGVGGALSNIPYSIYLATSGIAATNTTIAGNSCYQSNAGAAVVGVSTDGNTLSGNITDNTFTTSGSQKFINCGQNPTTLLFTANRYFGSGGVVWNGLTFTSVNGWAINGYGQEPDYLQVTMQGDLCVRGPGCTVRFQDTETNGHTWLLGTEVNGSNASFDLYDRTADKTDFVINFDAAGSFQVRNGAVLGWSSDANYADGAAMDTGISRLSANVTVVGNGSPADHSGALQAGQLFAGSDSYSNRDTAFGSVQILSAGVKDGLYIQQNGVVGWRMGVRAAADGDGNLYINGNSDTLQTNYSLAIDTVGLGVNQLVIGAGPLATNATQGFLYLDSCAGTPTGTPSGHAGTTATVYDTTNDELGIYNTQWNMFPFFGTNTAPIVNQTLKANYCEIVTHKYTIATNKKLTLAANSCMRIL